MYFTEDLQAKFALSWSIWFDGLLCKRPKIYLWDILINMVYNSVIKMYEVIVFIFDRLPFPPLNPSQQISNHTVLLMFLFKRLSLVEKCPPPFFFF